MDQPKKRTREEMETDGKHQKKDEKEKINLQFNDTRKFYSSGSFLGEKTECDKIVGKFNNFIKSVIMKRCLRAQDVILDIGGGHGQDLEKYRNSQIGELVLVDQSEEAIKEARKRYRDAYQKNRYKFNAYFLPVVNAFDYDIMDKLLKDYTYFTSPTAEKNWMGNFDVVSSQLAFHYAFINEYSIRRALKIVSSALKSGGVFIGTIPNGDFITEKLIRKEEKHYTSHSERFKLTLTDDSTNSQRCQMTICNKTGPLFEPIVTRDTFDAYAAEFGLEPYYPNLHFKDFSAIFNYYIQEDEYRNIAKFFSDMYSTDKKGELNETVKEQYHFYCAFAYKKR
jgi:mRNA (guanine-N7-)-methyltransferase